jgi:hypothetical protein
MHVAYKIRDVLESRVLMNGSVYQSLRLLVLTGHFPTVPPSRKHETPNDGFARCPDCSEENQVECSKAEDRLPNMPVSAI